MKTIIWKSNPFEVIHQSDFQIFLSIGDRVLDKKQNSYEVINKIFTIIDNTMEIQIKPVP